MSETIWDGVVVGGGPAGAIAAETLARAGRSVLLLNRAGRIKPCGGAIPPRLIEDFSIPPELLVARARSARMVAPSFKTVDMAIEGGFVGMVDRAVFDPWLRARAETAGAVLAAGTFAAVERDSDGMAVVVYDAADGTRCRARARCVVGADGAKSRVAQQCVPGAERVRHVFAYHEILRAPAGSAAFDPQRCDVYYQGAISPDFYGWVFPHGEVISVGSGSMRKGFSIRQSVTLLRARAGLAGLAVVRREGAPIPLRPMRRWDNGRDVVLAGDAAGVVAPASGEGIYYAMEGGRLAGLAAAELLATGNPRALRAARRGFMRAHGRVFWILGLMQHFWYRTDARRERFVAICRDPEVQRLTWDSYMNKRLTRARPAEHARILLKDLAHLVGLARA